VTRKGIICRFERNKLIKSFLVNVKEMVSRKRRGGRPGVKLEHQWLSSEATI